MRITGQMIARNLTSNLQSSLQRMARWNEQLSTGKRISRPSDDPVGTHAAMRLRQNLAEVEQYKANVEDAMTWLKVSDDALDHVGSILHRAHELAVQGANDTMTDAERADLVMELDQLLLDLIDVGNTKLGNRFIFGGQNTLQEPFAVSATPPPVPPLPPPPLPPYHVYNGTTAPNADIVYEIGEGVTLPVNVTGLGAIAPAIDAVWEVHQAMTHYASDPTRLGSTSLDAVQTGLDQLLSVRASLGAKTQRLERGLDRLGLTEVEVTRLLSVREDTDVAEAIMHLKMEENVYRSALAVSARMMQPSLVDFLR